MNTSIGWLMPGKVGTFAIIFLLKKKGLSYGQGTSVLIIDKLITLFISCVVGIIGIFVFFKGTNALIPGLMIIIVLLVSFFFLITNKGRTIIKKYFLRKYAKYFAGFSKTNIFFLKQHKGVLLLNTLITILKTFVGTFYTLIIFMALGVNIPILILWYIWGIEFIISLIPITINGLGTRESVGLYFYSLIGIAPAIALGKYIIGITVRYGFAILSFMLFDFKSFMKEVPNK